MHSFLILTAAAVLGIDVGWKNRPEGGVEYLIQIEPGTLESLKAGSAIESDIPSNIRDVRSFRITSGKGALPQEEPRTAAFAPGSTAGSTTGSAPGAQQPMNLFGGSRPTSPGLAPAPTGSGAGLFNSGSMPPPPSALGNTIPRPPTQPNEKQTAFSPAPKTAAPAGQDAAAAKPATPATPAAPEEAAPAQSGSSLWMWLIISLVALAASLSWNAYLLWMLRESRRRYRALLRQSGISEDEVAEMDLDSDSEQDD